MDTKRLILVIVISLLIAGNIYFVVQLFLCKGELNRANEFLYTKQINEKTLAFSKLFVDKVLKGGSEIDFEDRLKLENSVREINDQEIFDQWQKFVKGGTDQEDQQNLTKLLKLLVIKIYY